MLNRIRFAMDEPTTPPLSGDVEVDECYIGGKPRNKGVSKRGRGTSKQPVLAMVERGGRVRARPVANVRGITTHFCGDDFHEALALCKEALPAAPQEPQT